MSIQVAGYTPGKQQSATIALGDTLIIPVYGLPCDFIFTTTGVTVTAVQVKRYPSLVDASPASSLGVPIAASGVEDSGGYLSALPGMTTATPPRSVPCAAGQDAWSFTPTGAPLTVTWTLRRAKVEDPGDQS